MSTKRNLHVVPNGDGWAVKQEGRSSPLAKADTQAKASELARELGRTNHVEVLIHRPNGQIRSRDSYGNDPCPPKDKNT